ncbi:hypothetical protein CYLTODRAFT_492364 [Cylindrobasidium torrendii FP15055 ss-10]|uniref:ABC transporter n=1 Tax=Cylindrobasidium torrendii FP15055 ss-10 TaxID=1314674 RepID=A0A0D7B596_9AGAR|nr:hypothetical protein CYLTODRAFT_492364 [Cylindrobasidium torrendii FP15055 ss-10]
MAVSVKSTDDEAKTDVASVELAATDDDKPIVRFHERKFWQRVPFASIKADPPKASMDDADMTPEVSANWFSQATFNWVTPLLSLGYARPLEPTDLYKLPPQEAAAVIGQKIVDSFEQRQLAANAYNTRLLSGEIQPTMFQKVHWTVRGSRADREKQWREKDGQRRASLTWSINDSVKWMFWSGGFFKILADTSSSMSPLVAKAIIRFATESYAAGKNGDAPPIGRGVGLAICLLLMQVITSLSIHQFFYRGMKAGALVRGGLIASIYSRSFRLSSRARSTITNGHIMNHISTDVTRIDYCFQYFHMSWTSFYTLALCLILLLINLGPSALAGFALFVCAAPLQTRVMRSLFKFRTKSMQWTDKRVKLVQELLSGMKIVKFFAWEVPFLKRAKEYRHSEMYYIRSLLLLRSGVTAVALSLPVISSVVTFVVYVAVGNTLDPANVFASLALFNMLRIPLLFLPASLAYISDARTAVVRLTGFFEAELLEDLSERNDKLPNAVEVHNASFSWDAPPPEDDAAKDKMKTKDEKADKAKTKKDAKAQAKAEDLEEDVDEKKGEEAEPFQIKSVNINIPRGKLVAIVGPVGSGKTSLLQGLIGEMRLVPSEDGTKGSVLFGGSVGYCPQTAWIQNATIRANICFGRPFDEKRYWKSIKDSCLERDLEMLPNGDLTEVGEKGISLSGGQKQRLSICRTIYCGSDIQIFDDPLSALDAHVGRQVFTNVMQDKSHGQTRILVTHALHFLPQVDYIYTLVHGRVAEAGTYDELMAKQGAFSAFFREFGSKEEQEEEEELEVEAAAIEGKVKEEKPREAAMKGKAMMQEEERNTGSISLKVYKTFAGAGNGWFTLPLLSLALVMLPTSVAISSYWLVWWQEQTFNKPQGFYMGIYAGLGVSVAVSNFLLGSSLALFTYFASQNLHARSLQRIMYAPMSFFETTPLGRIMNRFSKDIDTVDNLLAESFRLLFNTVANIIGAVVLIAVVLPWFLIAVFVIGVLYVYSAAFYRASAREIKRLDAVLRSGLYAHFSESLSGMPTIRAYGESERFLLDNQKRIDVENRAYMLTTVNQRWLGIRLDFLGVLLTFVVSMLTVGTRFTISPSQTGVALSYILTIQQMFGFLIRQVAEVENDMNSVERVVHYTTEVEQEAAHLLPGTKPAATWPAEGGLELKDVELKYRPGLPSVLKGLTMSVKPGEKVGIVGRTGAGKSSIMTALYRIVELTAGSIVIDGVDISTIGLTDLRQGLSIIPQDAVLFSGTLRSNIDPFNLHDDVALWDALKRSYLVDTKPLEGDTSAPRFTLDSVIEDEGSNLSVGQRSLVSLARALVKNSKILVLDEATASVDYETDANIQATISNEFSDRTILCIAHRLRTIISYDRICVLDAGQIAEFDTPATLYELQDGIFRGMCEQSSITLDDILFAAKGARRQDEL